MGRRLLTAALAAALGALSTTLVPATAGATVGEQVGRIVQVSVRDGTLQLVFQAEGLPEGVAVDPASVTLTVAGRETEATARALSEQSTVRRTAVLALDNSRSMAGAKLDAAKQAALQFLDSLPAAVSVGLVTFGAEAVTAVEPSPDRKAVRAAIEAVVLDPVTGTALFDAAALATSLAGTDGARNVLLLTDGNEDGSSLRSLDDAAAVAKDSGVGLDAVYLGRTGEQPAELTELIGRVEGKVVTAASADLVTVFAEAAQAISSQILVTAALPTSVGTAGNVQVTAMAGSTMLSDSAYRSFADGTNGAAVDAGPRPLESGAASGWVNEAVLPLMLGALFLGLLLILYVAISMVTPDQKPGRVRRRLSIYTLTGRVPVKEAETTTALGSSQVARSAVELAGRVVQRRDLETVVTRKLDAAGVPLRPAEWMIVHVGVALGSGLLALLLSGGQILHTIVGLAAGFGIPYAYLAVKESRRTSAFLGQLPDTLQLVAGSLSAGYSLPQALDTVVREGIQPMSGELNRALVEARLGVDIEDALDGMAERMRSKDFAWVVMAIRIQREVGGNLAELLTTVSATLRERERLRRQVRVLSAEGRLSAWILGLLPPVFALYLVLVRPAYLQPLVSELLGWLMIGTGATLLAVGALWMRKAVKVEV